MAVKEQIAKKVSVVLLLFNVIAFGLAHGKDRANESISEQEAYEIGLEAYVYLYPLNTMDVTRRILTNQEAGVKPGIGPMNMFHHMRAYPDASFREVVRPNFDTLYSTAWLDLKAGPVIVSAPDLEVLMAIVRC